MANKANSVDVDKFDYLKRDTFMIGQKSGKPNHDRIFQSARIINNVLCFNIKHDNEMISLFQTRYKQYKQIYYHKTTVSYDLMCKDAFDLTNSYFNFLDIITDLGQYSKLDDSLLNKMQYLANNIEQISEENENVVASDILKAGTIIKRLKARDTYPFVAEKLLLGPLEEIYNKVTPQDICVGTLRPDDVIVYFHSVDYGNGTKNPFNLINFYKDDSKDQSFQIQAWKSSLSIPEVFKERYLRIYVKDKSKIEAAAEGFNIFLKKQLNIHTPNSNNLLASIAEQAGTRSVTGTELQFTIDKSLHDMGLLNKKRTGY